MIIIKQNNDIIIYVNDKRGINTLKKILKLVFLLTIILVLSGKTYSIDQISDLNEDHDSTISSVKPPFQDGNEGGGSSPDYLMYIARSEERRVGKECRLRWWQTQ